MPSIRIILLGYQVLKVMCCAEYNNFNCVNVFVNTHMNKCRKVDLRKLEYFPERRRQDQEVGG